MSSRDTLSPLLSVRLSRFAKCRTISRWRFYCQNKIKFWFFWLSRPGCCHCRISSKKRPTAMGGTSPTWTKLPLWKEKGSGRIFCLSWTFQSDNRSVVLQCMRPYSDCCFVVMSDIHYVRGCPDLGWAARSIRWISDRRRTGWGCFWPPRWWNICFSRGSGTRNRSHCSGSPNFQVLQAVYWKKCEECNFGSCTRERRSISACWLSSKLLFSQTTYYASFYLTWQSASGKIQPKQAPKVWSEIYFLSSLKGPSLAQNTSTWGCQ